MYQTVARYMQEQQMVSAGQRIIVGVSGGADSMALLHILHHYRRRHDVELAAAHLNHGLRAEARQEEELVRETCRSWDIPCYTQTVNVREAASREKKSLEEAGRDCRYRFFRQLADQLQADRIATAHHQNDQAESVLLHLLRGSGIRGLQGIKPVNGSLIRPLLCVSREDIEHYVQEQGLPFCRDLSNEDPDFMRNRIRLDLIPCMEANFNPRIVEALNRLAAIAREENQALDEFADRLWPGLAKSGADGIEMDATALARQPVALQSRLISRALKEISGSSDWSREDVERVRGLLNRPGSSLVLELRADTRVGKVYERLLFTTARTESRPFCYPVSLPGQVYIAETGQAYCCEVLDRDRWRPEPGQTALDLERLEQPLWLRSRQPGDRFQLPGLKGRKSLKKYFMEKKVPAGQRQQIPILASEQEIYAILGLVVAQPAALTPYTRRILVIKAQSDGENR